MPNKMKPGRWTWDEYFSPKEFADPHSSDPDSGLNMHPDFMDELYELRLAVGSPIAINPNGGFSSQGHASSSAHYVGMAADIRCQGVGADVLSHHLRDSKFRGIGFYEHWRPCSGFHIDMSDRRARWTRTKDGLYISLT